MTQLADKKTGTKADMRKSVREETWDIGEITIGCNKMVVACVVENISEHGARLEVAYPELPDRFVITNYRRRTKTLANLVWRNGRSMGVRFLGAPRMFDMQGSN